MCDTKMETPISPYRRGADQGFFFGLYLSAMFIISAVSVKVQFLGIIPLIMAISVPFIIYRLLRRTYVEEYGTSTLSALWMQGIMIFICGSLIHAIVAVVYLKWIEPDFIITQLRSAIQFYKDSGTETGIQISDMLARMIRAGAVPSTTSIVIETIWLAIFSGSMLSLLMSILARARGVPSSGKEKWFR